MNEFLTLLQENWLVTVIALLIILFILGFIFKAILRFIVFAVVIAAILMMAFDYTPEEVIDLGKQAISSANNLYTETVKPVLEEELNGAEFTSNPDGSYVIKTTSVTISGVKGEETATVKYKDIEFEIDVEKLHSVLQEQINNIEGFQEQNAEGA